MNSASHTGEEGRVYQARIEDFLQSHESAYSEPRLIEELFGIKLRDESLVKSEEDMKQLVRIKQAFRHLVEEKRIFAANFEDPDTKEQVMHYSAKGWFETP